jgi:membrane protein YdbS with pleckstrin-like domain
VSDANSSCPRCRTPLPAGSAFCNRCGAPIGAAAAPPAARPSAEPEQELWKGRYSGKAQGHWWVLWLVELAGLGYLWFAVLTAEMRGGPFAKWVVLAAAAVPALALLWSLLAEKVSTRYRLTTHRLFRERGVLSRRLDEMELLRVDDVAVRQNLIQRIFNVGIVTVIAPTDKTDSNLELVGIENPIEVKEMIRTQVRKRRDRSLHVESI